MSHPLPGLEKLISVVEFHGASLQLNPPSAMPPRAGEAMLGEQFDPVLADVYSWFDGGELGELHIGKYSALAPFNESMRDGAEPRLQGLFRYGGIDGLAEYFATVPSLAGADGIQPVVYLQDYMDKGILPIASNADRAFGLYALHIDTWSRNSGSLDKLPPIDKDFVTFPRSYVSQVARDETLVRMLEEGRFDELVLPDADSREWVAAVLRAARPA